jgi:hypothetical protein
VKAYGRLMTYDHTRLNHGLHGLRHVVQHEGVSLTRQLDQQHREEVNHLSPSSRGRRLTEPICRR